MKAAVTLVLLVVLQDAIAGPEGPSASGGFCCARVKKIFRRKPPVNQVKEAVMSRESCTVPALRVTMKNGQQVCVDPDSQFAKDVEKHLNLRPSRPTMNSPVSNNTRRP